MSLIKNMPIPICGLMLALLSLGNLMQDIHPALKVVFGGIGLIFLILIVLKVIIYPDIIRKDFKNPVIVSSSGTFSMSLMILFPGSMKKSPERDILMARSARISISVQQRQNCSKKSVPSFIPTNNCLLKCRERFWTPKQKQQLFLTSEMLFLILRKKSKRLPTETRPMQKA